jgi:hypothetical protein
MVLVFSNCKRLSAISHSQNSVTSYYTTLKGLWDELNNYRPLPLCYCDTSKTILEFQQQEYAYQLLMGLNESFFHDRGQILLMDPLPSTNKIFSIIVQEERQREITSNFFAPMNVVPAAMVTKYNSPKYASQPSGPRAQYPCKERPLCTHCGLLGHTVEKCYKLNGYPPGYKFTKGKYASSANQVSEPIMPQLSITSEQCQQLLRSKTTDDIQVPVATNDHQDHLFSEMADNASFYFSSFQTHNLEEKHLVFSSNSPFQLAIKNSAKYPWVIDTGAIDHIVCSVSFLTSITSVVSKQVQLPMKILQLSNPLTLLEFMLL